MSPGWNPGGEPGAGPDPGGTGACALTTTRQGGVSIGPYATLNLGDHVGDDPASVVENRRRLTRLVGCGRIQWLTQVHGAVCIESVGEAWRAAPEADAAWTRERGLGLAVLTADCVPVVLRARGQPLVAVAHAGWRGLVAGVVESLVAGLPSQAADLEAWIGPAIGPQAYEVGADVAEAVRSALGAGQTRDLLLAGRRRDRWQLDLFTLTERLLRDSGISTVGCERLCTYADARFFSYRRDGITGRMATVVWLPVPAAG